MTVSPSILSGVPPPEKPFPLPYEENFESCRAGETPRYLSDQKGTFETVSHPVKGLCLAQILPAQGIVWMNAKLLKPYSLFGDSKWQDCKIESDVFIAGGDVEIGGRYAHREKLGYRWILANNGNWRLNWQTNTLASGELPGFDNKEWHKLCLEMKGDMICGYVDGKKLAEVTSQTGTNGMAFIASTYDRNLFDNIRVGENK